MDKNGSMYKIVKVYPHSIILEGNWGQGMEYRIVFEEAIRNFNPEILKVGEFISLWENIMKNPLSDKENKNLIRKLKNGISRIDKELRAGTDKKNNFI